MTTRSRPSALRLVLAAAIIAAAAPARAQEVGYTASIYVSRGSYPAESDPVTSLYVFNGFDVTAARVRAAVSVPYVRTTFRDLVVDPATGAASTLENRVSGFGDPLVRIDVRLFDDASRPLQVAVVGSVKVPVVDVESRLGTGEMDVAAGGSLFTAMGGTSLFADLLFWKYGDPEGVDFEDTLSYSVGVGRLLGASRWSAMVSLAGFSKGLEGAAAPVQLNAALLTLISHRQSIAISAGFGLNDSSGGLSLGASWRISS
jgi:hypothetical protein